MAAPYTIWLRGSDTHFDAGATTASQVPTAGADSAPGTIAEPSVPNGWLAVDVYALDPRLEHEGEVIETIDGGLFANHDARWRFEFRTDLYAFPADWSAWLALLQHLSRAEVFFHSGDFDVALQAANTCLAVIVEKDEQYEHKSGAMYLKCKLRPRYPGEAL